VFYTVEFYGHTEKTNGISKWISGESVLARAYDNPIPGYGTKNSINLRL
jgi:starch phosphorylase